MKTIKAFPSSTTQLGGNLKLRSIESEGMTLRDYFATQAMNAIIGLKNPTSITDDFLFKKEAELSYAIADAMLKTREKTII